MLIPSPITGTSAVPAPIGDLTLPADFVDGNGWEVMVRAYYDFHTLLAVIPRHEGFDFAKLLNDKGAGTITFNEDDQIFSATLGDGTTGTVLMDFENLWEVYFNGRLIFDFLGETVTEALVGDDEQRTVSITGPGTSATLGWAVSMPPGFPNIIFKADAIQDGFDNVDQYGNLQVDTSIWNDCSPLTFPYPWDGTTGNPSNPYSKDPATGLTYGNENVGEVPSLIALNPEGTMALTASPSTTFMGATPYDLTNSLISAQITPMSTNAISLIDQLPLNGTQLTEMYVQDNGNANNYALFGLSATEFYMQIGDTTKGATYSVTKNLGNYDPSGDAYWQITWQAGSFYFWTSADGSSWVKNWVVAAGWTPNNVTVFVTATYSVANSQLVQVTNFNSNVTTPTSAGNVYIAEPCMSVWYQLLQDAQARGTIPFITTLLNESNDSFGNPWTDSVSQQITLGTDMYSLLQALAGTVSADFLMQPGFVLQVGLPVSLAGGVSLGRDLSTQIVMRESVQQTTKTRIRARDAIQNSVGAVNTDGTVVSYSDQDSIDTYWQREGWVETGAQVDQESMLVVVQASVDSTKDETLSWTLDVLADAAGASPFVDYDCGDWIGMERPGVAGNTVDAIRVIGIAMSVDPQGLVSCELTLNSYRQWLAEQLQFLMNKFGGQFIDSIGSTPVNTQQELDGVPVVESPSLGGLANVTIS